MVTDAVLNLSGQRLSLVLDDDDFKVITFWVPFDPTGWSEWSFLVRDRESSGDLYEWDVTPSDDPAEDDTTIVIDGAEVDISGKYPLMVDADTSDVGGANRIFGLFANRGTPDRVLPFITGRVTTVGVVQDDGGGS